MEVTVNITQVKRVIAGVGAASLLATALAVPVAAAPAGGSSRDIRIDGTQPGVIDSFAISAGESATFPIKVTNAGKQTVNNITLKFGADDSILIAQNGDATPPTDLPEGVTVAAPGCTGGSILDCFIGTLGARKSATVTVTISTTTSTPPTLDVNDAPVAIMTEAVVSVAESGGDAGSNQDTFGAQGSLQILGFSCESVAAYRPGSSNKEVSTCEIGANGELNTQTSKVKLPNRLSTVVLSENIDVDCPVLSGLTCIGDEVEANITDDLPGDVVTWTISIKLNGANVTLNKLVVVHTSDAPESTVTEISLAKKNSCKTTTSVNCGSASVAGDTLTIVVQTPGNGKTRLLG
jgi:hypothetical protein